ncbi:SDR family NAD(P)-dependent oxidoreductase [Sphingomonas mali]|uniref:SDR family NAD(P)-dependent oxidoreductase n=1 Tax=Sphingomonas mali TaxID=40682 RepID=UPI0008305BB5|nr:SDR family oxidoreductase [Sphingomonas mali]
MGTGHSSLKGRVALVTGASGGVGRSLALALASQGAKVAVAARRYEQLEQLAAEICDAGGEALAVEIDVEREDSVEAAFEMANARLGLVDTVVANAGILTPGRATDLDIATFDKAMAVNVRGSFLTARAGARRMIGKVGDDERGRVIFIASIAAHTPLPGGSAYCASKAAIAMMGKALAKEWARHGITVNTLCPGFMMSDMSRDWLSSEAGQAQVAAYPRRRFMATDDLAGTVLYLASDAARTVTGTVITVDDGQTL